MRLTAAQIKEYLLDRADTVIYHYAPPAAGHFTDIQGRYFTLNPARADRTVGSFFVHMRGSYLGHFRDFATGDHGDIIDLIKLSVGCSTADALAEARRFLGLSEITPEQQRDLDRARAARQRQIESDREKAARRAAQRAKQAQAIFLGAQPFKGTPVEQYLAGRGIEFSNLGRAPGAIRFAPDLFYKHVDPNTGEVIEGRFPAMVAPISDLDGQIVGVHRTYLGQHAGSWTKAKDLPTVKKVFGTFSGHMIHVWRGIGPRGGKPPSLMNCTENVHLYLVEGLEDALSAVVLAPELRICATVSVSNFAPKLPKNVDRVTLIADNDTGEEAQEQLRRAIAQHQQSGRQVAVWKNTSGGKDLNDALRAIREAGTHGN